MHNQTSLVGLKVTIFSLSPRTIFPIAIFLESVKNLASNEWLNIAFFGIGSNIVAFFRAELGQAALY